MKSTFTAKKIFIALMTFVAAFMLFTVTAYAEDYGNFSYSHVEPEDGEDFEAYNVITHYNESDESENTVVEIPSEIENDPVAGISALAFSGKSFVTEFIIPDTVTSIDNAAFYNSTALKVVVIPDSVTYIGDSAFQGCTSLEYVIIGDGVKEIGDLAFKDCTSLKYLHLGSSVETIGNGAFYNCDSLKNIYVPSSVKNIGSFALGMCQSGSYVSADTDVTFYTDNNKAIYEYIENIEDPGEATNVDSLVVSDGIKACADDSHTVEYVNIRPATDAYEGLDVAQCSVCHAVLTRPNTDIAPEEASASQWVTLAIVIVAVVVLVVFAAGYVKKSKKRRAEAIEAYKAGKPVPDLAEKEKADAKIAEKEAKKRAKQEAKLNSYK